ncbi:Tyr recombinase domain-containing protein OS=Streptomyces fumanus OX=67302 GN=GCM10018772_61570 PE=4 SV=1 [Streptomyces fumanus]
MFRALKREQVVFRDPARNVSATHVKRAPRRIPSDHLAGLLDRAPTAIAKAVVALVAIHALGSTEIRRLHLTDLNRSAGRLLAHRRGYKHTIYLDELTLKLLSDWLRERAER